MTVQTDQLDGLGILILEDDLSIRPIYSIVLRQRNARVYEASSMKEARSILAESKPQLAIVDVNVADGVSWKLITELADLKIPTMVISGDNVGDGDRIQGLELGADEYMVKPINPAELVLRLRRLSKLVRRDVSRPLGQQTLLTIGTRTVDFVNRSVSQANGTSSKLTNAEYDLLKLFVENPGTIIDRARINEVVFKRENDELEGRNVDILVSRLRKKIDPGDGRSVITSVRQSGYLFTLEQLGAA